MRQRRKHSDGEKVLKRSYKEIPCSCCKLPVKVSGGTATAFCSRCLATDAIMCESIKRGRSIRTFRKLKELNGIDTHKEISDEKLKVYDKVNPFWEYKKKHILHIED